MFFLLFPFLLFVMFVMFGGYIYIYILKKKKKTKIWGRGVNCEEEMRKKKMKWVRGDVCMWWGRREK